MLFTWAILKKSLGLCCCYWSSLVCFMNGGIGDCNKDDLNLCVRAQTHTHTLHPILQEILLFSFGVSPGSMETIRDMSLTSVGQDLRENQEFFRLLI